MNLDEGWELIPEEGFLEIHDDGGKQIYSRKYSGGSSKCMLQRNYFICPPNSTNQFVENTDTNKDHHTGTVTVPGGDQPVPLTVPIQPIKSFEAVADQDPVTQVFFKKIKETEFIVDMKLESPRSNRGIMPPQIDGAYQFEGDHVTGEQEMDIKKMELGGGEEGGVNVWKCCLSGIGAICSFGMAAATISVIVLSGSHHQNKHRIQFQIYTNDKRIKKPVHHTGFINEAISAVRGVPVARPARITVGGQCSGSW